MFATATLLVLTGVSCFMLGAFAQQNISYRRMRVLMRNDPYVFQSHQSIFKALSFLGRTSTMIATTHGTEKAEKEKSKKSPRSKSQGQGSESIFRKLGLFNLTQVNKILPFMPFFTEQENASDYDDEHVASIMKYGFPGMDEIRVYQNFVLSYDRRNRIAHWVCEHLKNDCRTTDLRTNHKPDEYIPDHSIPATFSPNMRDFRNSDWVGGHMASPQNYKCDFERFLETYKFPNIIPICRDLKNHLWRRLEKYVRELAQRYGSVYVYTGPLFMPQRISFRNWAVHHHVMGMNTVAVPTHFFKIIIIEQTADADASPMMEGFVLPNADVEKEMDLRSFVSDIRDIEHFAGLKFYDGQQRNQLDGSSGNRSNDPIDNNE